MSKGTKQQYKQFSINTLEDACLVLKSLIIPVITDLDKFIRYASEAESLLQACDAHDTVSADEYESIHDKVLYQQREILRFVADHQSSSFSYIDIRSILAKKGFIKRALEPKSEEILNELLNVRNWTFHNVQSLLVADLEIAKRSILPEFAEMAEIKPLLNPVIIRRIESYSRKTLEGFAQHNKIRQQQFEIILDEMKKDYQELYKSLPYDNVVLTGFGASSEVQYLEQVIRVQDTANSVSNIAALSMGIQKGKYDGTDTAYQKIITNKDI